MAFLGPVATATGGTAARLLGSRALGAAATRLGARLGPGAIRGVGTSGGLRGLSATQFGSAALGAFGGSSQQNDNNNQPTPFGGASG